MPAVLGGPFLSNPPAGNDALSLNGSNWLLAITAVHNLMLLVLVAASFRAKAGEKIFHHIFIVCAIVGSITYFAQSSDLGYVLVRQINSTPELAFDRQIFWPRYVNWTVSFPSIIIALGLLCGASWANIIFNIVLSWIWVIAYLASALTTSNYKWGFFAFGTTSWLNLAANTLLGRSSAKRLNVQGHYTILTAWVNFLWLLYPIAYGLSDGGNRIGVTPGAIFFGILDLFLIPGLAAIFICLSHRWDYDALDLDFTRSGRVRDGRSLRDNNDLPKLSTSEKTDEVIITSSKHESDESV